MQSNGTRFGNICKHGGGLQQAFQSDAMTKPIHAGRAAEGGVLAASLAKEGITGVLDIFEADRGFGRAMSDLSTGLERWMVLALILPSSKLHKKSRGVWHVHAIIDAIIQLKMEEEFEIETIEQITIGSYQKVLDICDNPEPVIQMRQSLVPSFVRHRRLYTDDR